MSFFLWTFLKIIISHSFYLTLIWLFLLPFCPLIFRSPFPLFLSFFRSSWMDSECFALAGEPSSLGSLAETLPCFKTLLICFSIWTSSRFVPAGVCVFFQSLWAADEVLQRWERSSDMTIWSVTSAQVAADGSVVWTRVRRNPLAERRNPLCPFKCYN